MLDQSYTAKTLSRLLKKSDFRNKKYTLLTGAKTNKKALEVILNNAVHKLESDLVNFDGLGLSHINGKKVYRIENFDLEIIVRKLNDNIRRLYKVKQADRNAIIRQVLSLAEDGTAVSIIKLDIQSFYETIDREMIIFKLKNDHLLNYQSKRILEALFNSKTLSQEKGLPRGLCLSSTLSEIYLRTLDRKIKKIDGIFYYARYVDDLIIFTYCDPISIIEEVKNAVTDERLMLNPTKTNHKQLPPKSRNLCQCLATCTCDKAIEYLGYKISFPISPETNTKATPLNDKKRYIAVKISTSKIKKMKNRIVRSFLDFIITSNFDLLQKRIAFLTANYPLPGTTPDRNLKGGIFYNYPHLNDLACLHELDVFLRKLIFSQKGSIGKHLRVQLTDPHRAMLKKFSFINGWKRKKVENFSSVEFAQIRECWKYE